MLIVNCALSVFGGVRPAAVRRVDRLQTIWLGIMVAINLQTSFLTPPFGFALFYLRGVAPEGLQTAQLYRGVIPFVMLQIALLAMLWMIPVLATWLPAQLRG